MAGGRATGCAIGERGYDLDFAHGEGFARPIVECAEIWCEVLRQVPRRALLYTPARPERAQQNVVVSLPRQRDIWERPERVRVPGRRAEFDPVNVALQKGAFERMGLLDDFNLRVLVCDRDSLLAWVGIYRPDAFTEEQRQAVAQVVPALQRRLALERQMQLARFHASAVDTLIEQLAGPAFLTGPRGEVLAANASARARLEEDPPRWKEALAAARAGTHPQAQVSLVRGAGLPECRLVVFAGMTTGVTERIERVRVRYGLTPRQTEVLARIASGASNRAIAAALDCAERTVEIHVTAILAKLGVESRSAALARVYAE